MKGFRHQCLVSIIASKKGITLWIALILPSHFNKWACKSRMNWTGVGNLASQLLQAHSSPVNRALPPSLLLLQQLLLSIHFSQGSWSSAAHRDSLLLLYACRAGRNTWQHAMRSLPDCWPPSVDTDALQRHQQLCFVALWTTADPEGEASLLTPIIMQLKKKKNLLKR